MSLFPGSLPALEICGRQTTESPGFSTDDSPFPVIVAASPSQSEEALFLTACRERGLLADVPYDRLRQAAVGRFGRALFQTEPVEKVLAEGPIDQDALTGSSNRVAPDALAAAHLRELGRHSWPENAGATRSARNKAAAKAGGIFYTPEYVARYMVARAIESLQANACPMREATPPTILDPACGCGAFLLAAYRYLRGEMPTGGASKTARRPGHKAPVVRNGTRRDSVGAEDWRERRRQILRRLHGIDLDAGAVLAARRALWLEAADEPAGPLLAEETDVFFDTIRQGNALVGPALDPRAGSFDLVLGNPPYRRELGAKRLLDQIAQTEFGRRWRTPRMDLWYYFAHRAVELLREGGVLSLVVSGYWTAAGGAAKLVEQLRRETHVEEVFDLDRLPVFDGVVGRHLILRARKGRRPSAGTLVKRPPTRATSAEALLAGRVPAAVFKKSADELFRDGRIDLEPGAGDLLATIGRHVPLGRLGRVRQGIAENPASVTRQTVGLLAGGRVGEGVFVLAPDEVGRLGLSDEEQSLLRPYHVAGDVGRYYLAEHASHTLIYSTDETCPDVRAFPAVERHLARFRPIMEARRETRQGRRPWWQLHWPREASLWTADKILSVQMARRPAFAVARGPVYVGFSVNVFVPDRSTREDLLYFAALLNSDVLWQWYRHHAKRRGVGLEINGRVLAATPIRRIDFSDAADRRMHDELVELAGMRACMKPEGLGIGDWGLEVGQAVPDSKSQLESQSLIPNPQSLANPQSLTVPDSKSQLESQSLIPNPQSLANPQSLTVPDSKSQLESQSLIPNPQSLANPQSLTVRHSLTYEGNTREHAFHGDVEQRIDAMVRRLYGVEHMEPAIVG
ncbi:MAG: N-6 DNA methylase [Pirellulales bacterium]|nr:N-6 DNA methylase [Pirellulales bacterium]